MDQVNYWRRLAAKEHATNDELRTELAKKEIVIDSYRFLAILGWLGFVIVLCIGFVPNDAKAEGYDEYCLGYFNGYQEGYCEAETDCIAPATYCPPPRPGDLMDYSHGFSHGVLSGIAARQ